jgi:hypothetical protein
MIAVLRWEGHSALGGIFLIVALGWDGHSVRELVSSRR